MSRDDVRRGTINVVHSGVGDLDGTGIINRMDRGNVEPGRRVPQGQFRVRQLLR